MLVKNYLAAPGGFLRGVARALDLGDTLTPGAVGGSDPLDDDAASLRSDWEALIGDQRRAFQHLSAELGGTFNGKSP